MDGLFRTNVSPPATILSLCFLAELKMMSYNKIMNKSSQLYSTLDFWQQLPAKPRATVCVFSHANIEITSSKGVHCMR